jgi:hypothetical protein
LYLIVFFCGRYSAAIKSGIKGTSRAFLESLPSLSSEC